MHVYTKRLSPTEGWPVFLCYVPFPSILQLFEYRCLNVLIHDGNSALERCPENSVLAASHLLKAYTNIKFRFHGGKKSTKYPTSSQNSQEAGRLATSIAIMPYAPCQLVQCRGMIKKHRVIQ